MRVLIRKRARMSLEQIGMATQQIADYRSMISSPGGLDPGHRPDGIGQDGDAVCLAVPN